MSSHVPLDPTALFIGLVKSEVSATLRLIPNTESLTFNARMADEALEPPPNDTPLWYQRWPDIPVRLYIGTYGDSHVYACPDGSVHKEVFRTSPIRKEGKLLKVNAQMGKSLSHVPAPFFWDPDNVSKLYTPMPAPLLALVQLYCLIWRRQEGRTELDLPVPNLHNVLAVVKRLQRAIDLEVMLPRSMWKIQVVKEDDVENVEEIDMDARDGLCVKNSKSIMG